MATQDGGVTVESSKKMWSTGEGNGKPLQRSCLENSMNSMKKPKDTTLKDEHHPTPQVVGVQYAAGEEQRNSSRRDEEAEPKSGHDVQLWMSLVVKVKSDAVKNSIA